VIKSFIDVSRVGALPRDKLNQEITIVFCAAATKLSFKSCLLLLFSFCLIVGTWDELNISGVSLLSRGAEALHYKTRFRTSGINAAPTFVEVFC